MNKELNGRVAFLLGATRGMGKMIALRLVKCGVKVGIAARKQSDLDAIKKQIENMGGECLVFQSDILDEKKIEESLSQTEKLFGNISIFYNGVGIAPEGTIESLSFETIDKVLDVNIKGIIHSTKIAIPYLKKSDSSNIINVSSMAATRGLGTYPDYNGVYAATKWAINGFDECMEKYLVTNYNIHTSTLCPGTTDTSLWDDKPLPFPREDMIPVDYIADVVETILRAPDSVVFKQVRLAATVEINNF